MGVVETAHAIVEIANASMVNALRLVTVQRGYDPRDFVLIAFGGAGPVHANRLAAETEVAATLIPRSPGVTSALGLLVTDLKHDYCTTVMQRADRLDLPSIQRAFENMEAEGRAVLLREAIAPEEMHFSRQVDVRYVGQSYELPISLPDGPLGPATVSHAQDAFHQEHDRAYGYSAPGEPVEWVNLRLTAVGRIVQPRPQELADGLEKGEPVPKASRQVYFAESSGYVDCPVYDRYRLGAGSVLKGPAIVEEFDSTTVIHPGYRTVVDRFGNLLLQALDS
jgi:N-methylhydantoinase A